MIEIFSMQQVYRTIIPSLSPEIAVQQVTHYAQNIISGKFQLFDYGEIFILKLSKFRNFSRENLKKL